MSRKETLMTILLLASVMVTLLVGAVPQALAKQVAFVAKLAVVQKEVLVKPSGQTKWMAGTMGMELRTWDRVRTGPDSRAVIVFKDGSQVRLNNRSLLEIAPKPQTGSTGNQGQGGLRPRLFMGRSKVKVMPGQAPLEMETPDAVAAVKGTEYDLSVLISRRDGGGQVQSVSEGADWSFFEWTSTFRSVSRIAVLEGSVGWSNQEGSVQVDAGHGTIAEGGSPPAPPSALTEDEQKELDWDEGLVGESALGEGSQEDGQDGQGNRDLQGNEDSSGEGEEGPGSVDRQNSEGGVIAGQQDVTYAVGGSVAYAGRDTSQLSVRVYDQSMVTLLASGLTSSSGVFSFTGLAEGTYTLVGQGLPSTNLGHPYLWQTDVTLGASSTLASIGVSLSPRAIYSIMLASQPLALQGGTAYITLPPLSLAGSPSVEVICAPATGVDSSELRYLEWRQDTSDAWTRVDLAQPSGGLSTRSASVPLPVLYSGGEATVQTRLVAVAGGINYFCSGPFIRVTRYVVSGAVTGSSHLAGYKVYAKLGDNVHSETLSADGGYGFTGLTSGTYRMYGTRADGNPILPAELGQPASWEASVQAVAGTTRLDIDLSPKLAVGVAVGVNPVSLDGITANIDVDSASTVFIDSAPLSGVMGLQMTALLTSADGTTWAETQATQASSGSFELTMPPIEAGGEQYLYTMLEVTQGQIAYRCLGPVLRFFKPDLPNRNIRGTVTGIDSVYPYSVELYRGTETTPLATTAVGIGGSFEFTGLQAGTFKIEGSYASPGPGVTSVGQPMKWWSQVQATTESIDIVSVDLSVKVAPYLLADGPVIDQGMSYSIDVTQNTTLELACPPASGATDVVVLSLLKCASGSNWETTSEVTEAGTFPIDLPNLGVGGSSDMVTSFLVRQGNVNYMCVGPTLEFFSPLFYTIRGQFTNVTPSPSGFIVTLVGTPNIITCSTGFEFTGLSQGSYTLSGQDYYVSTLGQPMAWETQVTTQPGFTDISVDLSSKLTPAVVKDGQPIALLGKYANITITPGMEVVVDGTYAEGVSNVLLERQENEEWIECPSGVVPVPLIMAPYTTALVSTRFKVTQGSFTFTCSGPTLVYTTPQPAEIVVTFGNPGSDLCEVDPVKFDDGTAAVADDDGNYVFNDLAGGTYALLGEAYHAHQIGQPERWQTQATVQDGETVTVVVDLDAKFNATVYVDGYAAQLESTVTYLDVSSVAVLSMTCLPSYSDVIVKSLEISMDDGNTWNEVSLDSVPIPSLGSQENATMITRVKVVQGSIEFTCLGPTIKYNGIDLQLDVIGQQLESLNEHNYRWAMQVKLFDLPSGDLLLTNEEWLSTQTQFYDLVNGKEYLVHASLDPAICALGDVIEWEQNVKVTGDAVSIDLDQGADLIYCSASIMGSPIDEGLFIPEEVAGKVVELNMRSEVEGWDLELLQWKLIRVDTGYTDLTQLHDGWQVFTVNEGYASFELPSVQVDSGLYRIVVKATMVGSSQQRAAILATYIDISASLLDVVEVDYKWMNSDNEGSSLCIQGNGLSPIEKVELVGNHGHAYLLDRHYDEYSDPCECLELIMPRMDVGLYRLEALTYGGSRISLKYADSDRDLLFTVVSDSHESNGYMEGANLARNNSGYGGPQIYHGLLYESLELPDVRPYASWPSPVETPYVDEINYAIESIVVPNGTNQGVTTIDVIWDNEDYFEYLDKGSISGLEALDIRTVASDEKRMFVAVRGGISPVARLMRSANGFSSPVHFQTNSGVYEVSEYDGGTIFEWNGIVYATLHPRVSRDNTAHSIGAWDGATGKLLWVAQCPGIVDLALVNDSYLIVVHDDLEGLMVTRYDPLDGAQLDSLLLSGMTTDSRCLLGHRYDDSFAVYTQQAVAFIDGSGSSMAKSWRWSISGLSTNMVWGADWSLGMRAVGVDLAGSLFFVDSTGVRHPDVVGTGLTKGVLYGNDSEDCLYVIGENQAGEIVVQMRDVDTLGLIEPESLDFSKDYGDDDGSGPKVFTGSVSLGRFVSAWVGSSIWVVTEQTLVENEKTSSHTLMTRFFNEANMCFSPKSLKAPTPYTLTKTADKATAEIGDMVRYSLRFSASSNADVVTGLVIKDMPAKTLSYVPGSARVTAPDGQVFRVSDPKVVVKADGQWVLEFSLAGAWNATVNPGEAATLTYRMVVGPASLDGATYANEAVAVGSAGGGATTTLTAVAMARVNVAGGLFGTSGSVVGKAFRDDNEDGRQSKGEPAIPGLMLLLSDGGVVKVDDKGQYSIGNVKAGTHAIKVDSFTVPPGLVPAWGDRPIHVRLMPGEMVLVNLPLVSTTKQAK